MNNLLLNAMTLANDHGFDQDTFPPGKFEGEAFYIAYYFDAVMNGDGEPLYEDDYGDKECIGDLFDVTQEERDAFGLDPNTTHVVLWYSESGFVTLDELDKHRYESIQSRYL